MLVRIPWHESCEKVVSKVSQVFNDNKEKEKNVNNELKVKRIKRYFFTHLLEIYIYIH
jgi:hypothetical protein